MTNDPDNVPQVPDVQGVAQRAGQPTGRRVTTGGAAARALAAERRWQAWQLKIQGYSLRAIARALDVTHATVDRYLDQMHRELAKDTAATASRMKQLLLDRYESYLVNMRPLLNAGDPGAVRAARQLGAEIAKMYGLYEPIQVDFSGDIARIARENGLEYEELLAEAQQILAGG